MRYLFSVKSLERLQPYLDRATLLAFDFDGTLAPIVMNPGKAALPRSSAALLKKLGERAPVALISGRSLADLRSRSPFRVVAWIGNHGVEGLPGTRAKTRKLAGNVAAWERSLKESLAGMPDILIENKRYSLTLHFRASARRSARRKLLLELVRKLRPAPSVIPGKCVLNLLSRGQPHKGDALLALMKSKKFSSAIFVGDDDTDEEVFRLRDPRIFSIRVGARRGSMADAYLRGQEEVDAFLRLLLRLPRRREAD